GNRSLQLGTLRGWTTSIGLPCPSVSFGGVQFWKESVSRRAKTTGCGGAIISANSSAADPPTTGTPKSPPSRVFRWHGGRLCNGEIFKQLSQQTRGYGELARPMPTWSKRRALWHVPPQQAAA